MWILGLNSPPLGWHDPTACLVDGEGNVHAMIEEERVTRRKHGLHRYPREAAAACLRAAGLTPADIDVVAVGWDMPRHSARKDLDRVSPPILNRSWEFDDNRGFLRDALGWRTDPVRHPELVFVPHHYAHACASFYASGYEAAAVLVVDGNGDDESVSIYDARYGQRLLRRDRWPIPHSLGYMYDAVSEIIGLSFLEAGKTMGLAAYGRAREWDPWPIFDVRGNTFTPPFDLPANATHREIVNAWWAHFDTLGYVRGHTDSYQLDKDDMAVRLAWSAQAGLQDVLAMLAARAREVTGHEALCVSGGVGLNCSANGLLPQPVYVPPVPHDAGVSVGAAWSVAPPARPGRPLSPYLGRTLLRRDIDDALAARDLKAQEVSPDEVARRLLEGRIGAVVTGAAEVGPRALCHRSIIASPADADMKDRLNRAKGRELWRPLGPAGLARCADAFWADGGDLHRYMVGASPLSDAGKRKLPAVMHVDGTARPQVVTSETGLMHDVLERLDALGAPPVTVNTSFNLRGEPVVDDAEGAVNSAMAIGLDFLVLEDRMVEL
ncbi:carbamoyltransferase C-terminal domain-containing protein [Streptomyces sp. SS8]